MTVEDRATKTRISGGEDFFESLFENSADAYLILDDNRFVDCNQATVEMLRADSKEEVLATHPSELSPEFQPDGRRSDEKADQMIAIALERGSNRFEWFHRRMDGDVFPVEVVLNPIPVDGKTVIQTIWRDITERKQVETAIRESEQRLSLMVEQSPLAVIEWNLDFEVTSWNPAAEAIFGYTSEEAIGQHAAGLIVPEEVRPIVDQVWSDLLEQEGGNRSTNENMTKDGHTIVCEWYNTPLIDPGGNTIGVVSIVEDITEQKEAERELQLSRTSIEKAEDAFFWFDADANFVDVSERTCEVLGYSREELLNMQVFDVDPSFPKEAWPDLKQQVQEKGSTTLESQHQAKDGHKFPVQITVSYLEFEGEEAFFSIARDITERKEAQEELLSSEQRFRTVADFTYDWEYWLGVDGTFEYVSPSCKRISGYQAEEFRQNPDLFEKIVAPEDKKAWEEHVRTYHGEHSDAVAEMNLRIVTKENEVRWLGHVCQAVHDDDGEWQGRRASNRDITERRKTQERIRIFQTLADNAADAITMTNLEGQVTYANRATYQLLGYDYDKRELIGNSMASLAPEEEQARQAQAVGQLIASGGSWTDEAEAVRRDGSRIAIEATMFPLTDEAGRAVSVGAILRDITDRKLAEEAQRKYQELFLSSRDAIASVDMEGNILDTNQAFLNMLGYTSEELEEIKFTELTPEKWHAKESKILGEQVMVRGYSDTYEKEYIHKDGHTFPVELEVYLTHDEEGNPSGFWGFIRDITERKAMEAQLEQAFERRGEQVQLSTEIAQEIATATELSELFEQVVNLTKENLGYYHTQLLQYDPGRDAVVLITGYGDIGEQMLAQDHQMPMGSGLIGTAADVGETVMRPTLAEDPDWQPNPLLPETRGEVAVPIKMRDEVLGVLDVQSDQEGALTDDDRLLLEGLCGQIAIAINETRLRQEMEEQLNELNSLYRAMSREGWQDYRQRETLPEGFVFDQLGVKQIDPTSLTAELFADVPMIVPGGEEIGSLAVQMTDDHPLYPDEQEFVEQVAEQVALALESARLFEQTQTALAAAQESENQLTEAMRISQMANWEFDLKNLNFHFTDRFFELMGTTAEEHGGYVLSAEKYIQNFTHPDDVELISGEIQQAMTVTDPDYRGLIEYRVLNADGETRFVESQYRLEFDDDGNPLVAFGSHMDVTERKKAEQALREISELQSAILEGAEYAIIATTPDGTLTAFNPGAEHMLGYKAEEVVGKHDPGIFHDMDEIVERAQDFSEELGYEIEPGFEVFIAKAKQNLPNEHEWTYVRKDGSRFPVLLSVTALRDDDDEITGFLGIASDITERKAAQEATAKRAAELSTVAEVGTTISSLLDPEEMLQTVVDLTKERFDLYHAHIYLMDGDEQMLKLVAGAGDVGRQMAAEGWEIPLEEEQSLVARAARERHGVIANDVRAEADFMANPLLPDTAAELAVPLVIGDQVLGVLDVQSDQVDNFTDEDVSIKTTLASQVAVALQNVRTYTRTQQQAEHETLVNVISQQIQSTTDIETALQVAVRELGRALGAKRTSVELGAPRKATSERK